MVKRINRHRRSLKSDLSLTGRVIGVTGSFGTGKTTVAGIFKKLGAGVINADKIAHNLLIFGSPAYKKTVSLFGNRVLNKDRSIDRKKLAAIIFNNRSDLARYLKIMHPPIKKIIRGQIKGAKDKVIVLDAPLLIEANLEKAVDALIVVKANRKNQAARVKEKFGLNNSDILKRTRFQLPLSDKIKLADYTIDNNGTLSQTKKQVKQVWDKLTGKS